MSAGQTGETAMKTKNCEGLRGLFRKCQPGLRRAGLAVRPKNSAWLRIADSIDC
jgi:hypothetical protein